MKRIFLTLTALSSLAIGCTPTSYVLKGHVADSSLVDHNVYLCDAFVENYLDTAFVASDGTFEFHGSVASPDEAFLANVMIEYSEANTVLVIENGTIKLDIGYVDGNYIPVVGGTPMNDAIYALDRDVKILRDTLVMHLGAIENDVTLTQEEYVEMQYRYVDEFKKSFAGRCSESFEQNKNNIVGLFSVLNWSSVDETLNMDSIASVSGKVISSNPLIMQMVNAEKTAKATQPGKQYVDLTGVDPSGKAVSLSEFIGKGKLVLVDFWASWCVPCKEEIPNLALVNRKFSDKVTVVGLNVWDSMAEFQKAYEENRIVWPQIIDPAGQSFTEKYGVSGIPQIMLISSDGVILARDLRGDGIIEAIENALK